MNDSLWGTGQVLFAAPSALGVEFVSAGNNLSAVFVNTQLDLATPDAGPLGLTQVLSIKVPINLDKDEYLVGYRQKLIFGIVRTVGVRVLIVAELAGTLKCFEFDALEGNAGEPQAVPHAAIETHLIFSPQCLEVSDSSLLTPVGYYEATIMIAIQRRNLKETGLVQLDGLDVLPVLSHIPPQGF